MHLTPIIDVLLTEEDNPCEVTMTEEYRIIHIHTFNSLFMAVEKNLSLLLNFPYAYAFYYL